MMKLKKDTIVAFLALVPFFEPTYVSTLPLSGIIYDIYKILLFIILLFCFILFKKRIKASLLLVLLS